MILLELFIFFLFLTSVALLVITIYVKMKLPENKDETQYTPPIPVDIPIGGPEPKIRIHDVGHFYVAIGKPTEVGTRVEVPMHSGQTAIYELIAIEKADKCDMNWYVLQFIKYKDSISNTPNRL